MSVERVYNGDGEEREDVIGVEVRGDEGKDVLGIKSTPSSNDISSSLKGIDHRDWDRRGCGRH